MNITRMLIALGTALILQVLVGCSENSNAPSYDPTKVEAQIRESSRAWADVAVTHDTTVIETLFADDFLGTDSGGKLYTKREFIDFINANSSTMTASLSLGH